MVSTSNRLGHKPAVVPLVPRSARTVDVDIGERRDDPILLAPLAAAWIGAPPSGWRSR